MRIVSGLIAVCFLAFGAVPGRAQDVSVRVVHAGSGTPLVGALVSLRNPDGVVVVRGLTGPSGSVALRVPTPGRYLPRADGIGFRGVDGVPVDLGGGALRTVEFALEPAPFPLEELVVGANRSVVCDMRAETAHLTARVWDEARKALFGTVITRAQDPPRMQVELYRRQLTPGGWIAHERRETLEVISDRPFVAADPVELHEQGWARKDAAGTEYFGPDAELLLSDFFLEDHCFRAVATEDRRLGLEFSPHRRRKVPEVAGTLWLDPATMELRSLDFRFVNLELPDRVLRSARFGGRVTFDRLPTGGWYIPDWSILTPYLHRQVRINRTDYVVAWYQDVGGTASPIGAQAPVTAIVGQVFDSLAGRSLAGASISLGGAALAVSDSAGQFRFELDRQGDYLVTVSHPSLAAVGLSPLQDSVRVRGREMRLDLASPSAETQLALLCRRDVRRPNLGVLSAMVIDGPQDQDISFQIEVPRSVARPQAGVGYVANSVSSRVAHRDDIAVVQVTTRPGRPFYVCGLDREVPIRITDSLPGLPRRVRDVAGGRGRVHVMVLGSDLKTALP